MRLVAAADKPGHYELCSRRVTTGSGSLAFSLTPAVYVEIVLVGPPGGADAARFVFNTSAGNTLVASVGDAIETLLYPRAALDFCIQFDAREVRLLEGGRESPALRRELPVCPRPLRFMLPRPEIEGRWPPSFATSPVLRIRALAYPLPPPVATLLALRALCLGGRGSPTGAHGVGWLCSAAPLWVLVAVVQLLTGS